MHRDYHPQPDVREKSAALLKIPEGAPTHLVPTSGLLKPRDPDTVYAWFNTYLNQGIPGLINRRQAGDRHRMSKKKQELKERLRQAPGESARQEAMPTENGPVPSRWILRTIRASMDWLGADTLSGVHRVLSRCGLRIRYGRVQMYSPDKADEQKVKHLCDCLSRTARSPTTHVSVFIDEMGYARWPQAASVWAESAPQSLAVATCSGIIANGELSVRGMR